MSKKQQQIQKNIQNIDIRNPANHQYILHKELSKNEVNLILKRLKTQLRIQCDQKNKDSLKQLLRQLKSKYSIYLSKKIIGKFISASNEHLLTSSKCNFAHIQKEIKNTNLEICRKKYVITKNKDIEIPSKPSSSSKCKRRNVLNSHSTIMSGVRMAKQLESMLVKEKLFILKEFVSEDDFRKINEDLLEEIESIDSQKFGAHAEKIKNYTIYDFIIQKIFSLIQQDTNNIAIRQKYYQAYKKMKEQMIAIVTNQDQVNKLIKSTMNSPTYMPPLNKQFYKTTKKNYFQLQKEKQDLNSQIEQTLQAAKKVIADAFIKQGRPDYAYQMGLALQNRTTPFQSKHRL